MRHDIALTGEAFALRPVEPDDSDFIAGVRNDPTLSRFINRGATDSAAQRAWIEQYLLRPGEYYFIIQNLVSGAAEGTISIYDVDLLARTAEWGRWVLKPGSAAAVESALLIYRAAFDRLDLDSLYCRTVADNEPVVSFHDSSGAERVGSLARHFNIGSESRDAIEHRVTRELWPQVETVLAPLAGRTARLLSRSSASSR